MCRCACDHDEVCVCVCMSRSRAHEVVQLTLSELTKISESRCKLWGRRKCHLVYTTPCTFHYPKNTHNNIIALVCSTCIQHTIYKTHQYQFGYFRSFVLVQWHKVKVRGYKLIYSR